MARAEFQWLPTKAGQRHEAGRLEEEVRKQVPALIGAAAGWVLDKSLGHRYYKWQMDGAGSRSEHSGTVRYRLRAEKSQAMMGAFSNPQ